MFYQLTMCCGPKLLLATLLFNRGRHSTLKIIDQTLAFVVLFYCTVPWEAFTYWTMWYLGCYRSCFIRSLLHSRSVFPARSRYISISQYTIHCRNWRFVHGADRNCPGTYRKYFLAKLWSECLVGFSFCILRIRSTSIHIFRALNVRGLVPWQVFNYIGHLRDKLNNAFISFVVGYRMKSDILGAAKCIISYRIWFFSRWHEFRWPGIVPIWYLNVRVIFS